VIECSAIHSTASPSLIKTLDHCLTIGPYNVDVPSQIGDFSAPWKWSLL
jgi:hypothetical protein